MEDQYVRHQADLHEQAFKSLISELNLKELRIKDSIDHLHAELHRLQLEINDLEDKSVTKEVFQPIKNLNYAIITGVVLAILTAGIGLAFQGIESKHFTYPAREEPKKFKPDSTQPK